MYKDINGRTLKVGDVVSVPAHKDAFTVLKFKGDGLELGTTLPKKIEALARMFIIHRKPGEVRKLEIEELV